MNSQLAFSYFNQHRLEITKLVQKNQPCLAQIHHSLQDIKKIIEDPELSKLLVEILDLPFEESFQLSENSLIDELKKALLPEPTPGICQPKLTPWGFNTDDYSSPEQ